MTENYINPTVRVSDFLTGGQIKKLVEFVGPHVNSPYIFIPVKGDFIEGNFREFKLIRCQKLFDDAGIIYKKHVYMEALRDKLDTVIRRWCLNFGLENPVITW
jgi:hypothetical protein